MADPNNRKRILYSGVIVAIIGIGVGHVLYNAFKPPFESKPYQRLGRVYLVVTGVGGFFLGMSQEALRQMKVERDREEQQLLQQSDDGTSDGTTV